MTRERIAARIRERREAAGLSQSELAKRVDVDRQQVAAWESARNKPAEDSFLALARALNTSISYLFGETDHPGPPPDWHSGRGPGSAAEATAMEVAQILRDAAARLEPKHSRGLGKSGPMPEDR
jgi:transcriptional regulator with XRE-family HTH domain